MQNVIVYSKWHFDVSGIVVDVSTTKMEIIDSNNLLSKSFRSDFTPNPHSFWCWWHHRLTCRSLHAVILFVCFFLFRFSTENSKWNFGHLKANRPDSFRLREKPFNWQNRPEKLVFLLLPIAWWFGWKDALRSKNAQITFAFRLNLVKECSCWKETPTTWNCIHGIISS